MADKTVYLFHGDDGYIIKQKTTQLISKYDIDEFNVTTYDLEEQDIEEAINDASTIPFMANLKMVIVKNAYILSTDGKPKKEVKQNIDALKRFLERPNEETLLVLQAPYSKLDERKAITKLVKQHAEVVPCVPLGDQDLRGWIKRQLGKHGIGIEAEAMNELLKRVENNTEVLVSETQKLILYAEDMRMLDLDTIKKVVTKNVEDNVYEITNSLLSNQRGRALEIYNDLVMHSEDPLRILGILVNKYREILHTKLLIEAGKDKADIADYFRASSGRAFYIMKNARSVRTDIVESQLEKLEELDFQIKTGQIDKKIGLELFILST
jgi:DNA polymerase-3 subunit delta